MLKVENLAVSFWVAKNLYPVIKNVSLNVKQGEVYCLAGESGSGKSVILMTVMGLLAENAVIAGGSIQLGETSLLDQTPQEWTKVRGKRISMIFQEPMKALNPSLTIGYQLLEILKTHKPNISKEEAYEKCIKILEKIHIHNPIQCMKSYPHHLSGGMRQRVMIAMAIINEPELLIADEPTTALDVTVQSQVIGIIEELKETSKMSTLFVTHDFGVISEIADRVGVLYGGQLMEEGDVKSVLLDGKHPYTIGLVNSIPTLDTKQNVELSAIYGTVPGMGRFPKGCGFATRCGFADERCLLEKPPLVALGNQLVSCFHAPLEGFKK